MISIRLKRIAKGKHLTYSIVVVSNRGVERIGVYKPITDKLQNKYVFIDLDRLAY